LLLKRAEKTSIANAASIFIFNSQNKTDIVLSIYLHPHYDGFYLSFFGAFVKMEQQQTLV
jgi:hypothetical protein